MNLNYVCVILIQFFITDIIGQRQYTSNEDTSNVVPKPYQYPHVSYYSPYVSPYQYPYSSGAYMYPPSSAAYAPFLRPSQSFAQLNQYSNVTGYSAGLSTQQQYYLGPMNAAQAQYLTAHIQYLINYGRNPASTPQVQIPPTPTMNGSFAQSTPPTTAASTPTMNESFAQPTVPTTAVPIDTINISLVNSTDGVSNCSTLQSNTTFKTFNASDSVFKTSNSIVANINSSDPIVGTAQVQPNPFYTNTPYAMGNWFYNPSTAMYANLPSRQPFYPPGYGPWNPFVLNPAGLPISSSNVTQQPPSNTSTISKNVQESDSVVTPTLISSTGEGGMTDIENLPPQVKEFIAMIPDILSMPETSQLNPPANNAIIHQIGGGSNVGGGANVDGSETNTPASRFRKRKLPTRYKQKIFKSPRYRRDSE